MKITKFHFRRLRNAEHLSLTNDVLNITKPFDWAAANVLSLPTWVQESNTEFKNHLNKLGTVIETQAVKLADDAFKQFVASFKICNKGLFVKSDT